MPETRGSVTRGNGGHLGEGERERKTIPRGRSDLGEVAGLSQDTENIDAKMVK